MQMSVWEKETFFAHQDVIIVGSGLVGLWSALELKNNHPKLKITILERGMIPTGASTRNAGFACFGSPTELMHDADMYGEEVMWQIVEMRYKGIEKIRKKFSDNGLSFEQCGGYEVYESNKAEDGDFVDRIYWLNKGLKKITGKLNSFAWKNEKITEFGFTGFGSMLENKFEGCLHSGKLVQSLWQKAMAAGIQVFTGFEVKEWQKINNKIVVNPNEVVNFSTDQLIICTNAFTSSILPDLHITPARGQMLLTSPIEGLKMKGAFHFDEGYYYFRNLGNRILLGGARNTAFDEEETTAMETSAVILDKLQRFLSEHIISNQEFTIEQKWSGIMGFTANKQAVVKRIDDNVSVAISCNGMGVALAPVIAEKVADLW
jgi:glycine/D-amino acid oxidase-like deaminating enzyme